MIANAWFWKVSAMFFLYQSWKLTCAYLLILDSTENLCITYTKSIDLYFFRAKDQVKERIDTLSASINAPSAPSEDVVDTVNQNGHLTTEDQLEILSHDDGNPWEDVKELLVLEDSKYMLVVCDTVNWKCFPRWFFNCHDCADLREKGRNWSQSRFNCLV